MRSLVRQHTQDPRTPRVCWRPLALALLSLVTLAALGSNSALADDADDRRVRAGARLFRSLLAAETALEAQAGADGALHVVVFGGESAAAGDVSQLIAANGESGKTGIRDLPVKIERIATVTALDGAPKPAGIFLAGAPSDADLVKLIAWSNAAHIVLYSPFEGHVERGVAAGIAVEAKVQPYLNLPALQAAGVEIKPFYLKVAKVYP